MFIYVWIIRNWFEYLSNNDNIETISFSENLVHKSLIINILILNYDP